MAAQAQVSKVDWPRHEDTEDVAAAAEGLGAHAVDHDLPEVSLRVAFAQLAAVFAEGPASYVPARGDILTPLRLGG
jgi:hypothetical protein